MCIRDSDSTISYRRRPNFDNPGLRIITGRGSFGLQEVSVKKSAEQKTHLQCLPCAWTKEIRQKFLWPAIYKGHEQTQPHQRLEG